MPISYYITHPEAKIDPDVPAPFRGLDERDRQRAEAFAARDLLPRDAIYVSSEAIKAEELGEILAARHGNPIDTGAAFGEIDRAATGFLSHEDYASRLEAFYAHPDTSAGGWETANDAQARILKAIAAELSGPGSEPRVFVGHGTIGTLLKCAIAGRDIALGEDQGQKAHAGGGNLFAFDLAAGRLLCDWTSFENWEGI